jgi:hypothetical protein
MNERHGPVRTIVPARVGLGVAQVDGSLHAMVTIDDDETGGLIDIIIDKAVLGEMLAHGDDVRRRFAPQEVAP